MQSKTISQVSSTLRERIAKMAGVTIVDRSRYYTVLKGKTTLGWVTPGAKRERVDFPDETGKKVAETMFVATTNEIAPALKRLRETKPPKPVKKRGE